MNLFYNRILRRNPGRPDDPYKWHPVLRSLGSYTDDDVAKRIARRTKLTPKEAETALYEFEEVVVEALLEGRTVKLAKLGHFHLTLKTTGSDTKEAADTTKITKINVRFRPSVSLTEQIDKANFKKAITLVSELSD